MLTQRAAEVASHSCGLSDFQRLRQVSMWYCSFALAPREVVKRRITQLPSGVFFCDQRETSLQRHVRNDSGMSRQQLGRWNGEPDAFEQVYDFEDDV